MLVELTSALLSRGITPKKFSKLAREAFVRAAASRSRLRNGRVNHSKVAALTGLARKDIRRILNSPTTGPQSDRATRSPSERVIHGWLTDRRFISEEGHPRPLSVGGKRSAFGRLVKTYGGDISPRAVLEELMHSQAVRKTGERLQLRSSKLPPSRGGLGPLSRVIPALVDGLRIASCEQPGAMGSLLYRLKLHANSEAERVLIRERCMSSVQSLLYGLKESLAHQVTTPARKRPPRHLLSVTVLLADVDSSRS